MAASSLSYGNDPEVMTVNSFSSWRKGTLKEGLRDTYWAPGKWELLSRLDENSGEAESKGNQQRGISMYEMTARQAYGQNTEQLNFHVEGGKPCWKEVETFLQKFSVPLHDYRTTDFRAASRRFCGCRSSPMQHGWKLMELPNMHLKKPCEMEMQSQADAATPK